jgi:hypothetical protein
MSISVSGNYYGAGAGVEGYTRASGTSRFVPEVWSGKMQVKFYKATCLSEVTNNDWEGEIKDTGDTVQIRSVPNITINNYAKGQTLSSQVPNSTAITLTIDFGKYFQVVLDDVDKVQADVKLMDIFSDDAGEQMKISIEADVFANVGAQAGTGNFGTTAGVISGNINLGTTGSPCFVAKAVVGTGDGSASGAAKSIVEHIVDIGQVLDEQNVPETGRWILLPAAAANRMKKGDIKQVNVTGDDTSPIRNGKLGMIDRFTVYVSNNLALAASKHNILAGTRDAISFASQLTKVETVRSTSTFGDIMRGLNVYGYKVTAPQALVSSIIQIV